MIRKLTVSLALAMLMFVLAPLASADTVTPVVTFTSTSTANDPRPFTLGYEFTTTVTLDINAMGYWDDGLNNNHQVGLWDTSGNLLTSTTVLGTDAITSAFRFHSISDLILGPGTYVIGGQFLGNSDPFPINALGLTSIPGYTWITDLQTFGSGLNFPTFSSGGTYGNNGIAIVDLANIQSVPEPSSVMLLGTGLACLASRLRKKPSKRTAPAR